MATRIEKNVTTGEVKEIELTAQEIAASDFTPQTTRHPSELSKLLEWAVANGYKP